MRKGNRWRGALGRALFVAATAVVLLPSSAWGQAGRARVEEGNRLYREGRFEEAHQKYLEAMAEAPDVPVIPFNDGNALYQGADYQRAMEAYRSAIETGDPALAASAWYNLGNALYRAQQLEPALEAYKEALRLAPTDGDAKHNLERVLQEMQQQQDQQQQDGEEREENQEDQQQDQQDQQQQQGGEQDQEGEEEQEQSPQGGDQEEPRDEQQDQEQDPSGGDEPAEGEAPRPQEGQMTPEEAQRLLDAIDEDPDDVNRKPAAVRGRKPRKPW